MAKRPTRSPKPSRIVRENLENSPYDDLFDEINSSATQSPLSVSIPSSQPIPSTMAPLSATQRESLAAEKAEERLQQLHEEDLRIRRA